MMSHSWIHIKCTQNSLGQITNLKNVSSYKELVNPLEYEFDLEKEKIYAVIGVEMWKGTPWIYVVPHTRQPSDEIQIVPAVFFEFSWQDIPYDWCIKMDKETEDNLEILPKFLASIPHWFEKYVDEDEKVLELIHQEILNTTHGLEVLRQEDRYAWPFEEYK